jgi:hypothetical protein
MEEATAKCGKSPDKSMTRLCAVYPKCRTDVNVTQAEGDPCDNAYIHCAQAKYCASDYGLEEAETKCSEEGLEGLCDNFRKCTEHYAVVKVEPGQECFDGYKFCAEYCASEKGLKQAMATNNGAMSKKEKRDFDTQSGRDTFKNIYAKCKEDEEVMKAAIDQSKCAFAYEVCAKAKKADIDRNFKCESELHQMQQLCSKGAEDEKKLCKYIEKCTTDEEAGNNQDNCLSLTAYKDCANKGIAEKIAYDEAFDCANHSADMEGKCLEEAGTNQDAKKRCSYYSKCTGDDKVMAAKKEQTKCLEEYGKCAEKKEAETNDGNEGNNGHNETTTTTKGEAAGLGGGFLVSTTALLFLLH